MGVVYKLTKSIKAITGREVYVIDNAKVEADKLLMNAVLPCVFVYVDNRRDILAKGGQYVEQITATLLFVRETKYKASDENNKALQEEERAQAVRFFTELRNRHDYDSVELIQSNEVYDGFRRLATGYAINVRVCELYGICAEGGGEYSRSLDITSNGEYDVVAYDKANVNIPDAEIGKIIREGNDYKARYEEIVPTLRAEHPDIVGWLYTQISLRNKNRAYEVLRGADAYYIANDNMYAYENGDEQNPITYVDAEGNETMGSRNYTLRDTSTVYEILYGYVMNTTSDCIRDNYNYIYCHYCNDAIIPIVRYTGNDWVFGFVDLNFKEGYTDVTISFGRIHPTFFATNATSLNSREIGYVCGNPRIPITGVSFEDLEELRFSGLLQNVSGINKLTLPKLKHIGSIDKTTTGGAVITSCPHIKTLYLPELESVVLPSLRAGAIVSGCNSLESVICPKLTTITVSKPADNLRLLWSCPKITEVTLPELTSVELRGAYATAFSLSNLKSLNLPKLEYLKVYGQVHECLVEGSKIEELTLPSLKETTIDLMSYLVNGCSSLKRVYLPSLEKSPQVFSWYYPNWLNNCPNVEYVYLGCKGGVGDKIGFGANRSEFLTDVEIGEGTRQSIALFNINNLTRDNIVNHILNRLADNTDGSPIRITIGSTNLAKLSDEDKAIALNKNYTLA